MRLKKYNLANEKGLFSYIKTELDSDDYELLMEFVKDLKQQLKQKDEQIEKLRDNIDCMLLALENISIRFPECKEVYDSFKKLSELDK